MSDDNTPNLREFALKFNQETMPPEAAPAQSLREFVGAPPPPPEQFSAEGLADVGKAAAAGVGRGIVSIPGIVGDIAAAAPYAGPALKYAYGKARETLDRDRMPAAEAEWETAKKQIESQKTPEERTGRKASIFGVHVPTSEGMVGMATEAGVPGLEYKGRTTLGRVAGTAGEFAGGAFGFGLPGIAKGGVKAGLKAGLKEAVSPVTLGAGIASGTAHEMYPDSAIAPLAGALVGGLGAGAARQRFMPGRVQEVGERVAGDVARRHAPDVGETSRLLGTVSKPGEFAPGARPTTPQIAPEFARLAPPELRAPGLGEQRFGEQVTALSQRLKTPAPSMADALGIPLDANPMGVSATQARQAFDTVHDTFKKAADDAWSHPAIAQARYKTAEVNQAVDEAIKKMGPATFENMPVELRRYVEQLKTYGRDGIPLPELQKIKMFANSMVRNPMVMDKSGAVALTTLLDDVMTDTKNVLPRYMSDAVYPEAAGAWDAARKATAEYKKLFATDARTKANVELEKLTGVYPKGTTQEGMPIIPSVETLKFLDGPRALQTYTEMSRLPGMDTDALNRAVGDWMVGKLTKNGRDIYVDKRSIDNFLKNPRNAEIVNNIPGLSDRLELIANQSRAEQVQAALGNVLNDPTPRKFIAFMQKHGDDVREVFSTPEQQQMLQQLMRSSTVLEHIPAGPLSQDKLFQLMRDGDMFTILHGAATGRLAGAAAGAGAASLAGMAAPMLAGYELIGAGAGALGLAGTATQKLGRLTYGPIQEAAQKALSRAMVDPEYMRVLLQKPSIENILNPLSIPGVQQIFGKGGKEAAELGYLATKDTTPEPMPEQSLTIPVYNTPTGAPPVRARASGGRIGKFDHMGVAASLIRAAEKAKKGHSTTTQPLLEQPDEAITKALAIADEALS